MSTPAFPHHLRLVGQNDAPLSPAAPAHAPRPPRTKPIAIDVAELRRSSRVPRLQLSPAATTLRLIDSPPLRPEAHVPTFAPAHLSGSAERTPQLALATDRIREANVAAASMSALDARWVLAVQVARALDGGPAAILTPESRRRMLLVGERVGLRPFDTNLVVAIVQDAAREGDDPLGTPVVTRLHMIRPATHLVGTAASRVSYKRAAVSIIAITTLAAAMTLLLIRWLLAG